MILKQGDIVRIAKPAVSTHLGIICKVISVSGDQIEIVRADGTIQDFLPRWFHSDRLAKHELENEWGEVCP